MKLDILTAKLLKRGFDQEKAEAYAVEITKMAKLYGLEGQKVYTVMNLMPNIPMKILVHTLGEWLLTETQCFFMAIMLMLLTIIKTRKKVRVKDKQMGVCLRFLMMMDLKPSYFIMRLPTLTMPRQMNSDTY